MRRLISVIPTDNGWSIQGDTFETLLFKSGGRAEAAARQLAAASSRAGQDVQVRIFLADGSLAGATDYPASHSLLLAD